MIDATVALIRRWTTQDVARTNAAQASARLRVRRLQLEDADAFLARLAERHDENLLDERGLSAALMSDGHVDER